MIAMALAAAACTPAADRATLDQAVRTAIEDEIQHGLAATVAQDMDAYMSRVPDDYYHLEEDGRRIDKTGLRAMQEQAWALIPRTNRLKVAITQLRLSCDGREATVWTDQLWDRQMVGRDGVTEFNVVTTQKHRETWRETDDGWRNYAIDELGGTVSIDGELQEGS